MGNSNGKITAPISLSADVYPVLGLAKSGTYYDVGYACGNSHGKINKWSFRKPIRYNTPKELTTDNFSTALSGLDVYYSSDLEAVVNKALTTSDWAYLPPRPGTDWCRLTDFEGYNHQAEMFIYHQQGAGYSVYKQNAGFFDAPFPVRFNYEHGEGSDGSLSLGDLTIEGQTLDGWYYTAVLVDANGEMITGASSTAPIARNLIQSASLSLGLLEEKTTYTIVPMLSSVVRSATNFPKWSGGWFCNLPTACDKLMVLGDFWMSIDAYWLYESGTTNKRRGIEYYLYAYNRNNAPVTINNVQVKISVRDPYDPNLRNDVETIDHGPYTISANADHEETRIGGFRSIANLGITASNSETFYMEWIHPSGQPLDNFVTRVYN